MTSGRRPLPLPASSNPRWWRRPCSVGLRFAALPSRSGRWEEIGPWPSVLILAFVASLVFGLVAAAEGRAGERFTGPWDIEALQQVPAHQWGGESNGVRQVYYEGLPYKGSPTRVFAWLGVPAVGDEPVPGVILLHGGGQHAFHDWVRYWMDRGYAAISMDLDGHDPEGLLPDGGPRYQTVPFFGPFPNGNLKDGWIYHSVASVMQAHSLLAAQPGVNPDRIGLNGLSLGGSLVCAVAGVDARLRAAAPVYGAGFFNEGGYWQIRTQYMDCQRTVEWEALLDPGVYLPGVTCPILFQNGATDGFTPPDTCQRNVDACGGSPTLAMRPKINHGNFWRWPWGGGEVNLFLDHHLRGGAAPPVIQVAEESEDHVVCTVDSALPVTGIQLAYTTDLGPWTLREWHEAPVDVNPAQFSVSFPEPRPLWALVTVQVTLPDGRDAWFSTRYFFRDAEGSPGRIVLERPVPSADRFRLTGRKPFGQMVLLEASTDLCAWARLATEGSASTAFEFVVIPDVDWRFFRVRKWELMR